MQSSHFAEGAPSGATALPPGSAGPIVVPCSEEDRDGEPVTGLLPSLKVYLPDVQGGGSSGSAAVGAGDGA
jgi:hypothetical protein